MHDGVSPLKYFWVCYTTFPMDSSLSIGILRSRGTSLQWILIIYIIIFMCFSYDKKKKKSCTLCQYHVLVKINMTGYPTFLNSNTSYQWFFLTCCHHAMQADVFLLFHFFIFPKVSMRVFSFHTRTKCAIWMIMLVTDHLNDSILARVYAN